jgi:glycosyltransferase Alg8
VKVHNRKFQWNWFQVLNIILYFATIKFIFDQIPLNAQYTIEARATLAMLAVIGVWRYSWWFINFFRAKVYEYSVFPRMRKEADAVFTRGWRPSHIYFVIASYKEEKKTIEMLLHAMLRECRDVGTPATLYLSADKHDEYIMREYVQYHAKNMDFRIVAIRQTLPDKRIALGQCLRSMSRNTVEKDCPVILMDGDAIMEKGCLRHCIPFFHLDSGMHALTTHEQAIFHGPKWMENMTELRFAQRHLMMQSHSLSRKVMTLTGRLSMFRSQMITYPESVDHLENDYLNHWLWGNFRFLSGDDKSTWFWLLKNEARMIYIPDVMVYTVEYVEGNGIDRTLQNLLRWSGNMLRNNGRAIALGPKVVTPYIWWCIVDQRLVIWTALISPISAIIATISIGWSFVGVYLLWLAGTRMLLSLILFSYAKKVNMSFPFLLYPLQVLGAMIKVFMLFHLPRQKWANRASLKGGFSSTQARRFIAGYQIVFYMSALVVFLLLYTQHLHFPSMMDFDSFFYKLESFSG